MSGIIGGLRGGWRMTDFLLWIAFGAVLGFAYGWRRLDAGAKHAIGVISSTPGMSRADQRRGAAHIRGMQTATSTVSGVVGALIGAAIGGVGLLLFGGG